MYPRERAFYEKGNKAEKINGTAFWHTANNTRHAGNSIYDMSNSNYKMFISEF